MAKSHVSDVMEQSVLLARRQVFEDFLETSYALWNKRSKWARLLWCTCGCEGKMIGSKIMQQQQELVHQLPKQKNGFPNCFAINFKVQWLFLSELPYKLPFA